MHNEATEVLMEEHRVIERVLAALEKANPRLDSGVAIRSDFFIEASEFFKGFTDGCHHKKEETYSFLPWWKWSIVPVWSGGVMISEHDEGRTYNNGLRLAPSDCSTKNRTPKHSCATCT
jgi:hemerythrin-like domain-containing protein